MTTEEKPEILAEQVGDEIVQKNICNTKGHKFEILEKCRFMSSFWEVYLYCPVCGKLKYLNQKEEVK